MAYQPLGIDPPWDEFKDWTVTGDIRSPGSGWSETNYDYEDKIKATLAPDVLPLVEFDSEECQFFAYCKTREAAEAVVEAHKVVVGG